MRQFKIIIAKAISHLMNSHLGLLSNLLILPVAVVKIGSGVISILLFTDIKKELSDSAE